MYNNLQQPPIYESPSTVPFAQPMYSNQYEPIQYTNNTFMNQPSQPIYDSAPYQSSIYSVPTQDQQQYSEYSQYVDNTYMNQQAQPVYQTIPVQQQSLPNNNFNSQSSSSKAQGVPLSKGYKWPRKSVPLVCPQCGASVTTRVETTITIITMICAVILFFFTVLLTCIPFCIPAFKKSTHYCPYCSSVLGVRHELR